MTLPHSYGILPRLLRSHRISGVRTRRLLRMRRSMDHAKGLRRSEGAALANAGAVDDEDDGDRDKHDSNAAEERAGPIDAEGGEHVLGEEGEAGASEGAEECVRGYGRGGAIGFP